MYELTFIVSPEVSDENLQKLTADIKSFFVKNEIDIKDQKTSAKKRFAYPMTKKEGGFYVTFDFLTADGAKLSEIEKELKERKEILRFLIIKKPSNAKTVPVARPKIQAPQIKKKTEKVEPPKTKEEKEKEIKEIDKKLDEILKD